MIDARIAADLRDMAGQLERTASMWPEMEEEEAPRAAVIECVAILLDAAATTMPHPEQETLADA